MHNSILQASHRSRLIHGGRVPSTSNPVLDFGIDRATLQFIGEGLQRPECILAEQDGTLWTADSRGGVVLLRHDGTQQIITQRISDHFEHAGSEATRYLCLLYTSPSPR